MNHETIRSAAFWKALGSHRSISSVSETHQTDYFTITEVALIGGKRFDAMPFPLRSVFSPLILWVHWGFIKDRPSVLKIVL
jgi:hypothetical protein